MFIEKLGTNNFFQNENMMKQRTCLSQISSHTHPPQYDRVQIGINIVKQDEFLQPSWAKTLSIEATEINKDSQFVNFTDSDVSTKAQELASMMQETPIGVEINLVRGMSMQQIANVCGGVLKKMDDALTAGEISQQEYDDLSKSLDSYTAFMTEKAENKNAMFYVIQKTNEAVWDKITSGASDKAVTEYAEKIRNSWPDRIRDYLNENSYNRTVLSQMISAVRNGKDLSFDIKI